MCGIVGYAGASNPSQMLRNKLSQALELLQHRGPDQRGMYIATEACLGVTRLAIRDIKRGTQPMHAEDGTVIVFNGELYGTEAIRRDLSYHGHRFATDCDTEVFLHGYLEWGDAVLARLSGMFAVAIWDAKCKKLLLARDRWGEKPLYWAHTLSGLVFASEAKALRPWPGVDWTIERKDIEMFLRHGYLPGTLTGWRGVHKLLPGWKLTWHGETVTEQPYVLKHLPAERENSEPRLDLAADELRELILVAVQERLVSDRPVGAFLSGGIDSSTVVACMSRFMTPVRTYSISWQSSDYSEREYAYQVSGQFGTLHTETFCTPQYLCASFDDIAGDFDELFGDESMIPTALVAEVAKQDVDVVLTGDGGDELFGGYERYQNDQTFEEYLEVCSATQEGVMNDLLVPEAGQGQEYDEIHTQYYLESMHLDPVSARRWIDLHTYLSGQILTKVDRATMRVALEARAPFLDPKLVDWALACDPRLISSRTVSKRVLRAAVADMLPTRILLRPKMGFGVPLVHWFRTSLVAWTDERLFHGSLRNVSWLRLDTVRRLLVEHRFLGYNHYRAIFNLLVLESWLTREAGKLADMKAENIGSYFPDYHPS